MERARSAVSVFSEDDLLTIVTIYWATHTITSSARLYREEHLHPTPIDPVRVPLAISQPALEEYRTPERWWRRSQPVARYTELPDASHFPEWEAPDALARDLRAFLHALTGNRDVQPAQRAGVRGATHALIGSASWCASPDF